MTRRFPGAMRLSFKVLLVGVVCHFSTEIGFAYKFPPHFISPLWPTGAILFSVLVAAPVRHWWAYTLARTIFESLSLARFVEGFLIVFAVFMTSVPLFSWPVAGESTIAALVYLPLPFLLLAAVRFGPAGVHTSLLIVAFVSISSAVEGRGPFASATTGDNVGRRQIRSHGGLCPRGKSFFDIPASCCICSREIWPKRAWRESRFWSSVAQVFLRTDPRV